MGYTHYYTQTRRTIAREDWQTICEDVAEIVKHCQHVQGVALANACGDGGSAPEINAETIMLNGLGDDAHETFALYRTGRAPEYDFEKGKRQFQEFCKTARKPYDIAVTAVLCYLASVAETHNATSDGDATDWTAGLEMARAALPKYANRLDYPRWILEEARWISPWLRSPYKTERAGYSLRFCVDGHAYVTRHRDGAHYRFESHGEAARWLHKNRTARGEPDIWNASGYFGGDGARNARLARLWSIRLGELVRVAEMFGRNIAPPAYVRPGDFPEFDTSPRFYSVSAMIEGMGTAR